MGKKTKNEKKRKNRHTHTPSYDEVTGQLKNFYVNTMYTTFLLDDNLVDYLKKDVLRLLQRIYKASMYSRKVIKRIVDTCNRRKPLVVRVYILKELQWCCM